MFYIFGLALLLTAGHMLKAVDRRRDDDRDSPLLRLTRKLIREMLAQAHAREQGGKVPA